MLMKNISFSRRGLLLLALLTTSAWSARAQSVGIGTTAPDVSAALDIVSGTKGALLPRVAAAAALATPATGLLVFQTGAPAGFYYNAGTPGAPVWQQVATAAGAAVTASNGLTKTGPNIVLGGTLTGATTIAQAGNPFSLTGGSVGVGTSAPAGQLHLYNPGGSYVPLFQPGVPANGTGGYGELMFGNGGATKAAASRATFSYPLRPAAISFLLFTKAGGSASTMS